MKHNENEFSSSEKEGLYRTIFNRRDVRGQFTKAEIEDEVLSRVLYASHHAPSVGFMQPWNFVLIRSVDVRNKIQKAFSEANNKAAELFDADKQQQYRSLKLEGILESPLNVCITCDRARAGPVVLGRTSIFDTDLYSTVCAVQNFWLAARAEGLGVGWVSIIDQQELSGILELPDNVVPVAYLCVGYVSEFFDQPELIEKKWRDRLPLSDLICFDRWGAPADEATKSLVDMINSKKDFPLSF